MIEQITCRSYILQQLDKAPEYLQNAAREYTTHTREMGGRICNDGYPDARFKCTYGMRWNPIRHFLSKQRQRHSSMMNRMHIVQVCCCKYKAVGPEVAKSHIGKIRDMFGWSK